jgi:hypothetical protein
VMNVVVRSTVLTLLGDGARCVGSVIASKNCKQKCVLRLLIVLY